ncbi:MAG: Miniconductance mechanosensitive channel MscM [Phycisphaerae bacterium]|nr:Miniconductance mechanosensitive channel MscM [Phycisphaerae bacterium]
MLDYRRDLDTLANPFDRAGEMIESLSPAPDDADRPRIRSQIESLLIARREVLRHLVDETRRYLAATTALIATGRDLAAAIDRFSVFIDQRILWVRNMPPLRRGELLWAARGAAELVRADGWRRLPGQLAYDAVESPLIWLPLLLLAAAMIATRGRARRGIRSLGRPGPRDAAGLTTMAAAPRVLALTLWRDLPGPLLLALAGWRLGEIAAGRGPAASLGAALWTCAWVLLGLLFLHDLCVPGGLGRRHFRWNRRRLASIRAGSVWLMAVGLPLLALVLVMRFSGFAGRQVAMPQASLARLAFIVGALFLAVMLHRLFRADERGGLLSRSRAGRLRLLWHVLAVAAPPALALLSACGYLHTSLKLAGLLLASLGLLLGVAVAQGILTHWLTLMRARLSADRSLQPVTPIAPATVVALEEADREALRVLGDQGSHLIRAVLVVIFLVGLWLIWRSALPALSMLNRFTLWTVSGPDGAVPVTLAKGLLSLLTVAAMVVAIRNVPGLLEIVLLRPVGLGPDIRFAVRALCRYLLAIVALIIAFSLLGIGWSKVQWLVAAITVGLGFGLQEIFANFVSGIIVLFERPMRVGDVITVGDTTGRVTRIQMRSTTITDWDCKELIVPNKEFITGRLVNWTLSDRTLRITIPVSVAYGSDVELVRRLLLQCARENPRVLRSPPPKAHFEEFGESSLNFYLKVYLTHVEHMFNARDELVTVIERALRGHGVEIPFPQRDLHIRTFPPSPPGDGQDPLSAAPVPPPSDRP